MRPLRLLCLSPADLSGVTGVPFPKSFRTTCQTIIRRLFRVYGHIYASHFDQICALGIEGPSLPSHPHRSAAHRPFSSAHLNTSYRHFLLFATEVRLECWPFAAMALA